MLSKLIEYIWRDDAVDFSSPPSFWKTFLQIAAVVIRDLMTGLPALRAMSLVYTTLLSIVPLLAVSIWVLKGFGMHDQLVPALISLLSALSESSGEVSIKIVAFVEKMEVNVLGALGLTLLIFTAVSLIHKIESAFNHTWRLQASRNLIRRFSDYLSVILIGPVLAISAVGITASLANHQIVTQLFSLPYMNQVLYYSGKLLPFGLAILAFTFVYLLVPNTRVRVGSAFYGAFIAGLLWQFSSLIFTSFVSSSTQYTAIYSGFAIVLTSLIWLYLSWLILLIGASIAFYHQHPEHLQWRNRDMHLSARLREQIVLQVMVNIARTHDQSEPLPATLENLANYQRIPADILIRMLLALEEDGLIARTADQPEQYIPAKSIHRIRLAEILHSSRIAESESQADSFHSDVQVQELLESVSAATELSLGEASLADFLVKYENGIVDENSIV